jgi:hypothetical protein
MGLLHNTLLLLLLLSLLLPLLPLLPLLLLLPRVSSRPGPGPQPGVLQ